MTENALRRPPGRPRDDAAHRAILEAATELVVEAGYDRTTVDAIAARAGVGKQTIYRWWPTKADLVLDATAAGARFAVPVPDRGSYAADLRAFLRSAYRRAGRAGTADLLRALMIEAQVRPEFGVRFRTAFLSPRRDAFAVITERAAARGDLPAHPRPDTVADVVFGTFWYRLLATHDRLDERLVDDLVALLAPAA